MTKEDEKVLATAVVEREALEKRTVIIVLAAAMFLFVSSFTALAYGLHQVNEIAHANTKVICGLRTGYQKQYDNTVRILRENPNGIDLGGSHFTRAQLVQSRDGLKARLADTKDAKC